MNAKYSMRKADLNDTKQIQRLIREFAAENLMLPRSLNEIYENIRDFWVVEHRGDIIACGALHALWQNMAEVKSLAVNQKHQGEGLGAMIVKAALKEGKELKARKIFALTFVPEFFEGLGFKRGKKENMPHKIWSECIKCPHFPDCDEVLVIKELK